MKTDQRHSRLGQRAGTQRGFICITMRDRGSHRGDIREERGQQIAVTSLRGQRRPLVSGQWRGVVSSRGHMSGVASAGQWGVTSSGGVNGQHMSVVTSVTRDTRGQGIGQPRALQHWSVCRSHWTGDFTNLRKLREKL